ncbi:MAG: hypothetical protein ACI4SE_06045 [Lachnospiraceae bacterium]
MNRFGKGHRSIAFLRKFHLSILAFIVLMVFALYGLQNVSDKTYQSQRESLESALERSIAHCYALEGTYPPSLEYIKEHYGLIYDEDRFFVDYQSIGSNMMPDVTIIEK